MALSGDNFSWLKKSFILQGSEVTWHYGPAPDSAADNGVISEATESGRKNDNPQLAQMSPPIAHCWCNAAEKPWSSPLQWQWSSRLPPPSPGQRPLLADALFPKALSNCRRKKLKEKTLSVPLEAVSFEGKDDADWDFGEASPNHISAPTSLQDFRKALRPRFPICATSVSARSISMHCYDDKSSGDCPMTGCCDDGKGKARHFAQICCTIRWYHPERMNSFSQVFQDCGGGGTYTLIPTSQKQAAFTVSS